MKTFIFLLTALLITSFVNGQTIDSVHVFESDSNIQVDISGMNPSTGDYISNIETEVEDNEINIDLYFLRCTGFAALTPYDTTVNLGTLPPEEYLINCTAFLDINLDSSFCFPNYDISQLDSLSTTYIVLGVDDEEFSGNEISVYPNPFTDFITVDSENLNEGFSLVITDLNGKIIKRFETVSSKQRFDLSFIKQGTYIVKVITPEDEEISKRVIKVRK